METMRKEDRIINDLKILFDRSGYKYYKMRKFEEYSLYMENKNFLSSEYIITFNHSGKLLALKPDVTLSIVKNAKANLGNTEKLYYREGVFRYDRKSHEYKEVNQIGLEVVGNIDITTDCEIISLALRALSLISEKYVLCISNTGIIGGIFDHLNIESYEIRKKIISAIRDKSKHILDSLLTEALISADKKEMFFGLFEGKIPDIPETKEAADALKKTLQCMSALGFGDKIKIDFSIINDLDYYNGNVFNGFIDGIPKAILSGGRYDGLVEKFGAKVNAEGFAVYLDDLLYLDDKYDYDTDVLLLYNCESDPVSVLKRAEEIKALGETVRIDSKETVGLKYKRKELI
jgi:ATP phosphoribosyltransferase regulatory subunit